MRRRKVETMIKTMTENEMALTQARHRLEEAQARNRVKERKARTRRLIQEGAILEKLLPQISGMELDRLEPFLRSRLVAESGRTA